MTPQECVKLPCCVDERVCNDTFLRVEKVGPLEFVVADIWVYNSNCVFMCSNFQQRSEWLKDWLKVCVGHVLGTVKLIHKADIGQQRIRGYELYTDDIGSRGYFRENDDKVCVTKMLLPDCYEVKGGGYLRVPDLKTSRYLRTLGESFTIACKKAEDGSWTLSEKVLEQ